MRRARTIPGDLRVTNCGREAKMHLGIEGRARIFELIDMQRVINFLARCGCAAVIITACFAVLVAQDEAGKPVPKQISGGVLNGKATSLPKPEYPAAARAENASGKVSVRVLIDEEGNVVSAKTVSGHENAALRAASEAAALQAKFSPTTLAGNPVKVSGVITYNFVAKEELEDGMTPFAAGTILFLVRELAAHPEKFSRALEENSLELRSMLKETASDPDFPGLEPLSKLEATPADKRAELVESVIAEMVAKLKAEPAVWKFELGRGFSDVLVPVMLLGLDKEPDIAKLDQARMKKGLRVMKQMLANAPAEMPKDTLNKLNALAALADRDDLFIGEQFQDLFAKVEAVFDAVEP